MSELASSRAQPLRAEYERVYADRVHHLQKFYELKQETLLEAIQQVYSAVLQDDLLKTLKKDAVTAQFILERVRELFEEVVMNERELLIERLGQQLTELRSECSKLDGQNRRLAEGISMLGEQMQSKQAQIGALENRLKDEQTTKRTENQSILLTTEREHGELRKSLSVLEAECDHLRTTVKEKEQSLKAVHVQLEQQHRRREQLERRFHEIEGECQDLRKLNIDEVRHRADTTKQVSLLEKKIKEKENNSVELEEALRRHYKEKSAQYKSKIEKYKKKVSELTKSLALADKQQLLLVKSLEETKSCVEAVAHEQQVKLAEYRGLRDRQRVELERKHDHQMKESQTHYERLLESKIQQVEAQAQNSLAVLQEIQKEFRGQITSRAEDYENNYVRRERYESVMAEKDELLSIVRTKLEEKDAQNKELGVKITKLSQEREEAVRELREALSIIEQHEQVFAEMNERKRQLEAKIEQLLSTEKKTKKLMTEFENRLAVLTNQKEEKEQKLAKKCSKYAILQASIKELKAKYEQLDSDLSHNIRNLQQAHQQVKRLEAQKEQLEQTAIADRKETDAALEQLQSKMENQKREYEQRLEKSKDDVDAVREQLEAARQVEVKFQQEHQSHRQTMQKLSICEKELQCERTLQETNQVRFKQALSVHMEQVEQAKHLIEKLTSDYKQKAELSNTLERKSSAAQQRLDKVQPALTKYKKVAKASLSSLETLTRQIASLKDYISNVRRVYLEQMALWTSILQRDFEDLLRTKDIEFIGLKKQLMETQVSDRVAHDERLRSEFSAMLAEKAATVADLKNELKEKQTEIQQHQKSAISSMQAQEELTTKLRLSNLKTEELAQENLNEKKQHAERLEQLKNKYEQDRDRLVGEIEQKNTLNQSDFKALDKALLTLKGECDSIREGLERSKLSHQEEMESSRRKRESLEGQIQGATDRLLDQDRVISALKNEKQLLQSDLKSLQRSKAVETTDLSSRLKELEVQIQNLESDKTRLQRELEQNIKELESAKAQLQSAKSDNRRLNDEITQMNTIIGRTVRNSDNETLRMARHLDNETKELTTKVKELRRLSNYLGGRDPNTLRS